MIFSASQSLAVRKEQTSVIRYHQTESLENVLVLHLIVLLKNECHDGVDERLNLWPENACLQKVLQGENVLKAVCVPQLRPTKGKS